jgi:metal-responsive CopG/Arc/MetJ family transcriptional regulator
MIRNMKTIAITIDEQILSRIDEMIDLARKSGAKGNRSLVIREAVKAYVLQHERTSEGAREAAIIRRHRGRLRRQAQAAVREQAKP